jgi:hypothetical protein
MISPRSTKRNKFNMIPSFLMRMTIAGSRLQDGMKRFSRPLIPMACFIVALCVAPSPSAHAQFYPNRTRPVDLRWHELHSAEFRVIYPEGAEVAAIRTARILDAQYGSISGALGGRLSRFPVILNPVNSLSNGFVSSFNARSEIELRPIKGKALSPRSGSWLETVVPHELVHMVHFHVRPSWSATNALDLISPDLRRSVHGMAPLGVHEGIAVDHETHGVVPGGGRGRHAYFTGRFQGYGAEDPWSMGQLLQTSDFTVPFDRHYVGGYAFMEWLRSTYGQDAVRTAIEHHYRFPILGFGAALKRATGKWPAALHREFSASSLAEEAPSWRRASNHGAESAPSAVLDQPTLQADWMSGLLMPSLPLEDVQVFRPIWLDDDHLLLYVRHYNSGDGFFLYSLSRGSLTFLDSGTSVEDHIVSFSSDSTMVFYAAYLPSTKYDGVWKAEWRSFDVSQGDIRRYRSNASLFAPTVNHRHQLSLLDDLDVPSVVRIDIEGAASPAVASVAIIDTLLADRSIHPVQVSLRPGDHDETAVIARMGGVQGLWLADHPSNLSSVLDEPPPVVSIQEGSVLDVSWHPSERRLLLSIDMDGIINLYEYLPGERGPGSLRQITFSGSNVFEPSYSPDGSRIAFVVQDGPLQQLGIGPAEPTSSMNVPLAQSPAPWIPDTLWAGWSGLQASLQRDPVGGVENDLPAGWSQRPYSASLAWLKPRMMTYHSDDVSGKATEQGITFHGTDALSENSYDLTLSGVQHRLWMDFTYVYSGFWPGLGLNVSRRPSYATFRLPPTRIEGMRTLLLSHTTFGAFIPFRWNLSTGLENASWLSFTPSLDYTQSTFHPLDRGEALSGPTPRVAGGFDLVFGRNLNQNIRDLSPTGGWMVYLQGDRDFKSRSYSFIDEDLRYQGSFSDRWAFRGGAAFHFPVVATQNATGRLRIDYLRQSDLPTYDLYSLTMGLIDDNPIEGSNQGIYSDARFILPLFFPDEGGLTVPLYLSSVYLVSFTRSFLPMEKDRPALVPDALVYGTGMGLRVRFRLSNLSLDAGIGYFHTFSSGKGEILAGDF